MSSLSLKRSLSSPEGCLQTAAGQAQGQSPSGGRQDKARGRPGVGVEEGGAPTRGAQNATVTTAGGQIVPHAHTKTQTLRI